MLPKNNIHIVGCGLVGSYLLENLILFIHEKEITEEINIYLFDFDLLEPDNLPYLNVFNKNNELLYKPKCFVLESIFSSIIKENIKLHSKYIEYDIKYYKDDFIIDCRDTGELFSRFDIKINIDGDFGLINFGKKDINYKENTGRYVYKNSATNTNIFTALIVKLIFNEDLMKKYKERIYTFNIKEYLFNLQEVNYVF